MKSKGWGVAGPLQFTAKDEPISAPWSIALD